jgi:triacylglycerol lipase
VNPEKRPLPRNLPLATQQKLLLQPETNPTGYSALEHASIFPFEPGTALASRTNAWWLADASWLAYSKDPDAVARVFRDRADLACRYVAVEGAEAYFTSCDAFAIVVFRGTQPDDWDDLFDDACYKTVAWDVGHVHGGFARRLAKVEDELGRFIAQRPSGCPVWFTGHSLGAAIATLAAYRHRGILGGVYTFGSPLIGNEVFRNAAAATFQTRSVRYVNDHDIVTRVPPAPFALPAGLFTHIDHPQWIDEDGRVGTTAPSLLQFVRAVFGGPKVILDLIDLHMLDASRGGLPLRRPLTLPDGLADHTPLYYALHCWNDLVDATARETRELV